MLADFVADVGVVGMEFGQGGGVSVDVGESEFEFACGGEVLRLAALAQDDYPRRIVDWTTWSTSPFVSSG